MPSKKKNQKYVVMMYHRGGDDPKVKVANTYDEAAEIAHKFFLSYFSIQNGQPFDDGAVEQNTFTQIKMYQGKVAEFSHLEGEGPVCYIEKG